jgi:hypothetical protein
MGEVFARGEHQAHKISKVVIGEGTRGGSRKLTSLIFCMILNDYIF